MRPVTVSVRRNLGRIRQTKGAELIRLIGKFQTTQQHGMYSWEVVDHRCSKQLSFRRRTQQPGIRAGHRLTLHNLQLASPSCLLVVVSLFRTFLLLIVSVIQSSFQPGIFICFAYISSTREALSLFRRHRPSLGNS